MEGRKKELAIQLEEVDRQLRNAKATVKMLQSQHAHLFELLTDCYEGERNKPEIHAISGSVLLPEDCNCRHMGSCLAYCNPYK